MQASRNLSKLDLSRLIEKWPSAFVARPEIARFTGGLIQAGTLANLDAKGLGPEGKIRVGRKVAYEVHALVKWLEGRNQVDAGGPMAAARKKKATKGGKWTSGPKA